MQANEQQQQKLGHKISPQSNNGCTPATYFFSGRRAKKLAPFYSISTGEKRCAASHWVFQIETLFLVTQCRNNEEDGFGGKPPSRNVPVDQAEVKTYKFSHYRPIWCELAAATGFAGGRNRKTVLNACLLRNIYIFSVTKIATQFLN